MSKGTGAGARPSIRDVAEAAGVSITTVSHALSGKGRINEKTRERVRKVATEIGYEPSMSARGLVTGRSNLLAIQASGFESQPLVPQIAYFVDLLNAASATAVRHGFALVLLPPGSSVLDVRRLQVDGAAIIDPIGDEALLMELRDQGKPVVASGRVEGDLAVRHVDTDYDTGTRAMLDHMRSGGAKRIAVLTTERAPSYVTDVARTYRRWCSEQGLKAKVARVRGNPTAQAGERTMCRLLEGDPRPDAVFATLDSLAIGALKAANDMNLAVPRQFMVAALTDAAVLRAAMPPVTTLDLHPERIGERLIELLVSELEPGREPPAERLVAPELIPRRSTDRRGR